VAPNNLIRYTLTIFVALISPVCALRAQALPKPTFPPPAAPAPEQIATAQKVFIANGGFDCSQWKSLGDSSLAYSQFYADMKSWGHYTLVANPSDADLVFEIQFACPLVTTGRLDTCDAKFGLKILDPKQNIALWTITERMESAIIKSTAEKNFAAGSRAVMTDLQALVQQSGPASPN
jgi:hypothetical protein